MSKHTPGPWTVNAYNEIESGAVRICSVDIEETNAGLNGGEGQANARLIAAAPDLLEELRAVEQHLHAYVEAIEEGGGSASKSSERLASVRAAIAKATEAA